MNKKYELIKGFADNSAVGKERAAITLDCSHHHVNRMLSGYKELGKGYSHTFKILFIACISGRYTNKMIIF